MRSSSPYWTHLKLRGCHSCVLSLCITSRTWDSVVLLRSLILEATFKQVNEVSRQTGLGLPDEVIYSGSKCCQDFLRPKFSNELKLAGNE